MITQMIDCECCDQSKPKEDFYCTYEYSDVQVCNVCEETLDNKTGYCSIACRMSGNCDGSC